MIYSSPNLASNTLATLNEFRLKNQFCDVVINLNGKHFTAHKAVLLASSGYFRKVLSKNNGQLLNVKLSLSDPETFTSVLTYLYTGKIDLNEENLAEIVLVGTYLQVAEISKLTDKFIQIMQANDIEDDCEISTEAEETEEDVDLLEISNDDVQSLDSRIGIMSSNDDIETDPRIAETGDYKLRGKTFLPAKMRGKASTAMSATGRVKKRKFTKKTSVTRKSSVGSCSKILKRRPPASEYHQIERALIKLHEQDILFLPETNSYQCAICKMLFSSANNCSRHYRSHTREKPFECKYCHGKYTRLDTLQKHMDICQNSKTTLHSQVNDIQDDSGNEGILPPKICPVCTKGLRTIKGYQNHTERHYLEKQIDGKTIFSCQTCDKICYSTERIIDHCQQCYMFTCKYCRRAFKSRINLERHVRIHTGERPFACPICDITFTRGDSLFAHLSDNTAFIRCGKKVKEQGLDVYELVSETKKRITYEARAYQIPIDDKAWDKQNQLAILHHETKTPYFKCDICMASFYEFTHYSEHRNSEHGVAELMKCPICDLSFARETWLNKHMELHESEIETSDQADFTHSTSTFFMCQLCEVVFNNETDYVAHNGVMCADTCRFCQRPYQTRKCLEQHIRKHTGEKPFICHLCDDKFSSRHELKSHLTDEHMIETPKHSRLEPLPTVVVLHGDLPNDGFQIESNEIEEGGEENV